MLQEIIKAWVIPPALNCVLIIGGLLIARWHKTAGRLLIVFSIGSLILLSTDYIASALENSIQKHDELSVEDLPDNEPLTIVVAGSSHHERADEYGYPTPTSVSLERLHYASYLHRKTGYPVLITGGMTKKNQIHSEILAQSFLNEFKSNTRWRETKSRTTYENAKFSAEILFPLSRKKILLVTHSYHMNRTVKSFEKAGFTVIPAPTVLPRKVGIGDWRHWVPGALGLQRSANVIYEYIGLARDSLSHASPVKTSDCINQAAC